MKTALSSTLNLVKLLLPLIVLCISTQSLVFANPPEKVAPILDENTNENAKDPKELFLATLKGNTEEVKKILKSSFTQANVNRKFDYGMTSLMVASVRGFSDIVELLLRRYYKFVVIKKEEIDVNLQDNMGMTALIYASNFGHSDIVSMLLNRAETDVNAIDNTGKTALIYATANGHSDIVSLLLDRDEINVNTKDDRGKTALIYATMLDTDETTSDHITPTVRRKIERKINIISQLISHDGKITTNINIQDDLGFTAIMYVILENELEEAVKVLLDHPDINVHLKNIDGYTIFDFDMDYSPNLLELLDEHLENKKKTAIKITTSVA